MFVLALVRRTVFLDVPTAATLFAAMLSFGCTVERLLRLLDRLLQQAHGILRIRLFAFSCSFALAAFKRQSFSFLALSITFYAAFSLTVALLSIRVTGRLAVLAFLTFSFAFAFSFPFSA